MASNESAPRFDGDCAVVTGAASGIGRAVARRLAAAGASVVVADVREEPREGGEPTQDLITRETDATTRFVECNVTDPADREAAMRAADDLGGVDVLVNNAGVLVKRPFLNITPETYDRVVDVNLKGTFFTTQRAAERMLAADGGRIVNLSSIVGHRGGPERSVYSASKAAIDLLTYSLAAELGPTIRVNAVQPGTIETMQARHDSKALAPESVDDRREAIPSGRIGTPEDVADAVQFLASDQANYVNGTSLVVDGGRSNTL